MAGTTGKKVVQALIESQAFMLRPAQPFRLTSGLYSPFYVDCRKLISHVEGRTVVAEAMAQQVRDGVGLSSVDMVAGGVTAGVPFATLLADRLRLPMVYIRPEPKQHGAGNQIEGGSVTGKKILMTEDLITNGTSILKFAEAIRKAGGEVRHLMVVLNRTTDVAVQRLAEQGIALHFLCDFQDILAFVQSSGMFAATDVQAMQDFQKNPEQWSAQNT